MCGSSPAKAHHPHGPRHGRQGQARLLAPKPGVRNHEHCIAVHISRVTAAPIASHTPTHASSMPPAKPCYPYISIDFVWSFVVVWTGRSPNWKVSPGCRGTSQKSRRFSRPRPPPAASKCKSIEYYSVASSRSIFGTDMHTAAACRCCPLQGDNPNVLYNV